MKAREDFEIRGVGTPDTVYSFQRSLFSWRSILAGTLVALISYAALATLGLGIFANSTAEVLQNEASSGAVLNGLILWMGFSTMLALALGSFFASRTTAFMTIRLGAAQGLVIAALFFSILFYGVGQGAVAAGRSLGAVAEDASYMLASRPLKIFFATPTGSLLMKQLPVLFNPKAAENELKASLQTAALQGAHAVSVAAWGVFLSLFLGLGTAILGGGLGARDPRILSPTREQAMANLRPHPAL